MRLSGRFRRAEGGYLGYRFWVSPSFDPLLAKVIAHGCNREASRTALLAALGDTLLYGTQTNLAYLRQIMVWMNSSRLASHSSATGLTPHTATIRILSGGTMTTVQDWPGRIGYWHVGVPPSGPFDDLSFRLGNLLLGNEQGAPGLEMTVSGPDLLIGETVDFVLTGAQMHAMLDGRQVRHGCVTRAHAGSRLSIGKVDGAGIVPTLRWYCLSGLSRLRCHFYSWAVRWTLWQALSSGDVLQLTEQVEARNLTDMQHVCVSRNRFQAASCGLWSARRTRFLHQ